MYRGNKHFFFKKEETNCATFDNQRRKQPLSLCAQTSLNSPKQTRPRNLVAQRTYVELNNFLCSAAVPTDACLEVLDGKDPRAQMKKIEKSFFFLKHGLHRRARCDPASSYMRLQLTLSCPD